MSDLADLARRQLAANRFMVLGTVDPSGRPRVSPVWFSLVDHATFYWLSTTEAHHSRNIAERPEVAITVWDPTSDSYTGQAVYLDASAERVPDDDLAEACAVAFADVEPRFSFTPESLQQEPFVLYRARITRAEVHVRGSDPDYGVGIDSRVQVDL